MKSRLFDHIDLRVETLAACRPLFDALFPALGFSQIKAGDGWVCYSLPGDPKEQPFIQADEMPGHRGNANRFAFTADTEEEVNRLGEIARAAGALVVEGPEYCHDYTPGYYPVFFEDASGNKWEICCRTARVR
jgi:catechol 2,3-dioxygenase-like lactoylglutathione lyase family enzyme